MIKIWLTKLRLNIIHWQLELCALGANEFIHCVFPEWSLEVTTGPEDNMCTENTVSMVVYGEKRMSEVIELGAGGEYFQKGNIDKFQVYLSNTVKSLI